MRVIARPAPAFPDTRLVAMLRQLIEVSEAHLLSSVPPELARRSRIGVRPSDLAMRRVSCTL